MFLYSCFREEKMRYCRGGNLLKLVTQLVSGMAVVKPASLPQSAGSLTILYARSDQEICVFWNHLR